MTAAERNALPATFSIPRKPDYHRREWQEAGQTYSAWIRVELVPEGICVGWATESEAPMRAGQVVPRITWATIARWEFLRVVDHGAEWGWNELLTWRAGMGTRPAIWGDRFAASALGPYIHPPRR